MTIKHIKILVNPTGISHTNLSVRIQRVKHRGRRQKVPVSQVFCAALLEPKLLRFGEDPVAVSPAGIGDIFTLPPQCGAQRPDGRGDPEGRRLLDILHHHPDTNRWACYQAINTSTHCSCLLLKRGHAGRCWRRLQSYMRYSSRTVDHWSILAVKEDRICCFSFVELVKCNLCFCPADFPCWTSGDVQQRHPLHGKVVALLTTPHRLAPSSN